MAHSRAYLRYFGISQEKIREMGLQEIKTQAKKKYRQLVFKIHPDKTKQKYLWDYGNGLGEGRLGEYVFFSSCLKRGAKKTNRPADFCRIKKLHDKIQGLKYLPLTYCDPEYELLLKYQRGYQTTADVDFGLNSHLAETNGHR